ncbi:MAG: OmpA family protein [Mariprofundaceae bacterium]
MKKYIIMAVSALLLSSCISADDPNKHAKQKAAIGAGIGAIAGAVLGHQRDHSGGALRGALMGAAAGGAIGAGVGVYMDKQQAEFERELAAEQRSHQIEVERLENENLKITMNSEVSFDYDSAAIKPAFNKTLDKVTDIVSRYKRTNIRVVGHTDSRGTAAYNQRLSEDRAKAVAWYIEDNGVAANRVSSEGRGEAQPRDSNETEAGRQLNRRVELLIIPNKNIQ